MTKHGLNLKGFIRQFQINTTLESVQILTKPENLCLLQIELSLFLQFVLKLGLNLNQVR